MFPLLNACYTLVLAATPLPVQTASSHPTDTAAPDDEPRTSPFHLSIPSFRLLALDGLEGLQVGPSLDLSHQNTEDRSGTNLSLTPGARFPNRLLGWHDLWTHRTTPDLIADAERRVTAVDTFDGNLDGQERGTALLSSFTWTHTAAPLVDTFTSFSNRDPNDRSSRTAYRAFTLGSALWPMRRLPLRVDLGMRAFPTAPRLFVSIGYAPRHLPKSQAQPTAAPQSNPETVPTPGAQNG